MVKISVIVPVYRTAKYLKRCFDSILNQTFQDFEIIIVSDGPEEDDLICEEYYKKFPDKITRYVKGVGKGLGGARNAGIDLAQGEYISFIDSDDWIAPEFLQKMYYGITKEKDVDIVQCGTNIVCEGDFDKKRIAEDINYFDIIKDGIFELSNKYFGKVNVGTWNKLYKKELIQKYNLSFPEKMCNEDAYFTWAYWSVCKKIYFISEKLYNYVRRTDSLMGKTFEKSLGEKVLHHYKICEMLYEFLQVNNLFTKRETAFWKALTISWYFVKDNADEQYRKKGFEEFKNFLKDKEIPDSYNTLKNLKKLDYEDFLKGEFYSKNIRFLGVKIIEIQDTENAYKIRLLGLFSLYKKKYKTGYNKIYICGIPLMKINVR